jgi:hypothetical protein
LLPEKLKEWGNEQADHKEIEDEPQVVPAEVSAGVDPIKHVGIKTQQGIVLVSFFKIYLHGNE